MCACDVPRRKAGSSCPLRGVEVSTLYNFQSLTLRATGQDWITTVRDCHTPYEDRRENGSPRNERTSVPTSGPVVSLSNDGPQQAGPGPGTGRAVGRSDCFTPPA